MTDPELLAKKLAFIETCVAELRRLARPEAIDTDIREERFVEHTLQLAIQAAQDVASHIVSDERLGEPRTNRELFDLLVRAGWLSEADAAPWVTWSDSATSSSTATATSTSRWCGMSSKITLTISCVLRRSSGRDCRHRARGKPRFRPFVQAVPPSAMTHSRDNTVSEIRGLRTQEPTCSSGETGNGRQLLTES